MTAVLRVVLDQIATPQNEILRSASLELTRALVEVSPSGTAVEGIVPSVPTGHTPTVSELIPGLADVTALHLPRKQLVAAWQLGVTAGVGGGLIHSPTMLAPLVKHDRVHDRDQTVVTLWDLGPWEQPDRLPRSRVIWYRGMLKRAARYADAIVVPTHAAAQKVASLASVGDRVRVIPGAAPTRFGIPSDEVGRRRSLGVPEGYVIVSAAESLGDDISLTLKAVRAVSGSLPVVVIDAPEDSDARSRATELEYAENEIFVLPVLDDADRGAVFAAAVAHLAPSSRTAFPWRVLEALRVGVPVVAVDSPSHREILVDGAVLVEADDPDALAAGLAEALGSTRAIDRLAVLASDRGRAYSWGSSAERVWQLHADL